jgi:hypothetical protein
VTRFQISVISITKCAKQKVEQPDKSAAKLVPFLYRKSWKGLHILIFLFFLNLSKSRNVQEILYSMFSFLIDIDEDCFFIKHKCLYNVKITMGGVIVWSAANFFCRTGREDPLRAGNTVHHSSDCRGLSWLLTFNGRCCLNNSFNWSAFGNFYVQKGILHIF